MRIEAILLRPGDPIGAIMLGSVGKSDGILSSTRNWWYREPSAAIFGLELPWLMRAELIRHG
jgi:hypothetical protein